MNATRLQWAGRIMGGIAVLFLLFDTIIKLMVIPPVVESMGQLGYPVRLAAGIGILELACIIVYLIPRTSTFGAILLTGYLGGAVASHVRVGNPLFSHVLFPIYVALLLWGALYVRSASLRALIPLRPPAP
jgi:hypothetical protein